MKRFVPVAGIGIAAVLTLTACGSGSSESAAAAPSDAQVMALFEEWNASLATGDPAKVVAQYTEDAVLLPTVAGAIHDTPEEKTEYFTEFLELKPKGTWVEPKIEVISADAAVLSGLYDFAVVRDGKPETINARGTFVFERVDGEWQITQHHSSKKP